MQTSGCWGVGRLFFANLLADLLISDLDLSCPSKHIIFWYHKEMVSTQHTVCSIQKRHRYSTLGFFLQAHASINKAISGVSIPEPFASTNLNNSHFSLLFELSSSLTRRCTWFWSTSRTDQALGGPKMFNKGWGWKKEILWANHTLHPRVFPWWKSFFRSPHRIVVLLIGPGMVLVCSYFWFVLNRQFETKHFWATPSLKLGLCHHLNIRFFRLIHINIVIIQCRIITIRLTPSGHWIVGPMPPIRGTIWAGMATLLKGRSQVAKDPVASALAYIYTYLNLSIYPQTSPNHYPYIYIYICVCVCMSIVYVCICPENL